MTSSSSSPYSKYLDTYHRVEWREKCSAGSQDSQKTFIASWQGLALFSHLMLVLELPIHVFTAFCILTRTPRTMKSVKWVLLNSHLWCSYVDILICSLITPYFYFPTISGFPVGLFRILDVPTATQTFLGISSAMFMGNSLTALFENRSSCITANRFRIERRRTRLLFFGSNCLLIVAYLVPPFLSIPEQEAAKVSILDDLPCPTEEFFTTDVFILTVDPFWKTYLAAATGLMVLLIFAQAFFFMSCCVYHLYICTSLTVSAKTKQYQRSFFVGTITQAIVPLTFLALPVIGALLCIFLKYYNQVLNNSFVLFFSLHGFATTLVILLVHHPYRRFLLKVVTFDRSVDKNVSDGASYVTRDARFEMRRLSNRIVPTF